MPVGLPQGADFYELQDFGGLNIQSARQAIPDDDFAWLENMIPIGLGNLRAIYGPSAPLYTAPGGKTVTTFASFNVGSAFFQAVVLNDGSLVSVAVSGGAVTAVASAGTFTAPAMAQWGAKYLLIADPNGTYALWDGTVFYHGAAVGGTASLAPIVTISAGGSGYTSTPTVTVSGGSGSGASFAATVSGGIVTGVTITGSGSGYAAADPAALTLTFTGGGGTGAAGTVAIMPIGIIPAGTTVTDVISYQGRVWIVAGTNLSFTAPNSVSNFNSSAGGGTTPNTESTLRALYTALATSNGFLYPMGDSSVDVINNVVTASNVTTFSESNVDPQNGTSWPNTLVNFGRALVFANPSGVYGLYGGSAEKISDDIDGAFTNMAIGQTPSAALAVIYGIKVYLILLNAVDPFTGNTRPMMFGWDGKKWFVASQGNNSIKQIGTLVQNSSEQCWATDGLTLFQCFTTASSTLKKTFQSKLWSKPHYVVTKEVQRVAIHAVSNTSQVLNFTFTVDSELTSVPVAVSSFGRLTFVNNGAGVLTFTNGSGGALQFITSVNAINFADAAIGGKLIGETLTSTHPDFTVVATSINYVPTTAF